MESALFFMADRKVADKVSKAIKQKETFKAHLLHLTFHPNCPLCIMQEEHAQHWLETHKAS